MAGDRYAFGDITVDFRRMELRRAGSTVSLEPKTFAVLRHLIENRDRVVSKDELLNVVWTGTFVTPNVLTRAIAQSRKALGDSADAPRYVSTISKHGYRFIAPIIDTEAPSSLTSGAVRDWRWVILLSAGAMIIAGMLVTLSFNRRNRGAVVADVAVASPKRLTTDRHSYSFPAVSSDGRRFAYSSDRSGSMEIYAAAVDGRSSEVAITSDGGYNVEPTFSPDGQWLAYHSRQRGGVWIVASDGGPPRQLVNFGSMPAWSPDGETIAFTSDAGGMTSQATLWTARLRDSSLAPLTKLGHPSGGHLAPTWSPDGRFIAFRVSHDPGADLWIVARDGGALWKFASAMQAPPAKFSADSTMLYWVGRNADGEERLMGAQLNPNGRSIGEPTVILALPERPITGFSLSPNGTAILSLVDEPSTNLMAIDVADNLRASEPTQLTVDAARNSLPDYSRDGRILYQQNVPGRAPAVRIINENGSNPPVLSTPLSLSTEAPQWDRDGKRVFALLRETPSSVGYFAWIDLEQGGITPIVTKPSAAAGPAHLSPDGQRLTFHQIATDGVMNVWVQPLDGSRARQLTFDREAMSYPKWSHDGKWLTLVIKRGDRTHVGIVSADGGAVEQLTFDQGQSRPYSFSPTNSHIAFAGQRDGVWNVYAVSRATKHVTQLTHFVKHGLLMYPAWSPRGHRIVFQRAESTTSLWTLKLP